MLKDITIGQYFPGESPLHKLDPRIKIILTFLFITAIFLVSNYYGYLLMVVFTTIVVAISGVPVVFFIRSLRPMILFIVFTAILNMLLTDGTILWSWWIFRITGTGLSYALVMIIRITLLVSASSLLTYTTSPIALTGGIEALLTPFTKIGVPSHEIAMMMTIALRFIPTLIEETDKIMKAQTARGADFTSGGLIKRARALVPILVPLFVSAFRRADELAIAMESRCYSGGKGRTSMHILKIEAVDYIALAIMAIVVAAVVYMNLGMVS